MTDAQTAVRALVAAFAHDIVEIDGALLLATPQVTSGGLARPHDDPTGVEATCNKRYVAELTGHAFADDDYPSLMTCGRALVKVWAERISLLFPGRPVLFFLGGSEAVILRFHVRREGKPDWADLADKRFLAESRLEVYELAGGRLHKVA